MKFNPVIRLIKVKVRTSDYSTQKDHRSGK